MSFSNFFVGCLYRRTGKSSPSKRSKGEKSKFEDVDEDEKSDSFLTASLVAKVHQGVSQEVMSRFVEKFLLECNSTAVRWQAHSLVVTVHR